LARDLAEKYNIRSVPTVVLISDNGVEINRLIGVKTLNEYIENYNSNK
jgi:thioredoxin-related protein